MKYRQNKNAKNPANTTIITFSYKTSKYLFHFYIQLYVKLAYTTNEYFVIYGKKSTIYRGTTYVSVSSLNRWCFCFKLCELKNALNLQSSILNYFIFRRAAKLPALLARPARLI